MREHTKEQNGEKWEQRLGGWHLAWLIDRASGDNLIIANFQTGFGSSSLIAWRLPVNTWVALTLSLFLIATILYSSYSSTPLKAGTIHRFCCTRSIGKGTLSFCVVI